jgi:hypothetical protein
MTDRDKLVEIETAALMALSRANVPPDIQALLVQGDPMRGIPPHALAKAITAIEEAGWAVVPKHVSHIDAVCPGCGTFGADHSPNCSEQ